MSKDELITKQQLQIEDLNAKLEENKGILQDLNGKFYSIGAPLNDNILGFNSAQLKWCLNVSETIKYIN